MQHQFPNFPTVSKFSLRNFNFLLRNSPRYHLLFLLPAEALLVPLETFSNFPSLPLIPFFKAAPTNHHRTIHVVFWMSSLGIISLMDKIRFHLLCCLYSPPSSPISLRFCFSLFPPNPLQILIETNCQQKLFVLVLFTNMCVCVIFTAFMFLGNPFTPLNLDGFQLFRNIRVTFFSDKKVQEIHDE